MDPVDGKFEDIERRRRSRRLFRHSKIPVRMLVPNFFTLLSLCAGVTAIRMAIEQRYEIAVFLVVAAALLDGVDGRLARALKAQSKFGAELDSLADFVNFGVAPAILIYTWGLGGMRGFGWVAALLFACCMGLRLARFNSMLDVDKPKWQSNFFTGIPAPAGAIVVMLPFYLDALGLADVRAFPFLVSLYTLAMAFMLVSTIPTYSGKLLGERIRREWVLPIFAGVALLIGMLITYPYATLASVVVAYLLLIPLSYRRFQDKLKADVAAHSPVMDSTSGAGTPVVQSAPGAAYVPPTETKH